MKFNKNAVNIILFILSILTLILAVLSLVKIVSIDMVMIFLGLTQIFTGFNLISLKKTAVANGNKESGINKHSGKFPLVFGIILIIAVLIKLVMKITV